MVAALTLIGASWDARAAGSGSGASPEHTTGSLVLQGVTLRATAELGVDRMPTVAAGCGRMASRSHGLFLDLTSNGGWPAGVESVRLTAIHDGQSMPSSS